MRRTVRTRPDRCLRQSKTNPTAEREDYRLTVNGFARAIAALRSAADPQPADRVVPLSPSQVNRRVQTLARLAGLDGVSAHSGRRGMASELVRRGASTTAVQAAGGWRDPQMVARYASAVSVEDGAVARYFGYYADTPTGGTLPRFVGKAVTAMGDKMGEASARLQ